MTATPASASFTGVAPDRPESAEQVDQDAGDQRPGEGEPDVPVERAEAEHADGEHDGERALRR